MSTHNIRFYDELEKNYPRFIIKYSPITNALVFRLKYIVLISTLYNHMKITDIFLFFKGGKAEHFIQLSSETV